MKVTQNAYCLCAIIALSIGTYSVANNKAILNEILTNPGNLLRRNWTIYDQFSQEAMPRSRIPVTHDRLLELIQKYENIDPVFMLTECPCPAISRTRNPKYRAAFENAILTEYNQKLRRKNPITCISFASGGGFQDLVILCKILNQKPYAMISLHMIDPEYRHYIDTKKTSDLPRLMSLDQEAALYKKIESYTEIGYRYQQMLKFLEELFPNASIRLYSHETIDSFFEYAKKFNTLHDIDLIYTADIDDYWLAVSNYKMLCAKVLEVNRNVINIDLSKAPTRLFLFPYLLKYSLSPLDGGSSVKVDIDGKTITLYYATYSIDWLAKEMSRKIGQFNHAIAGFFQKIKNQFR